MKLIGFVASALLAASAAQAAPVVLNFDGAVDTDITNDFAGVTFNAPGLYGPVRTWAYSGADTPGNVVGLSSPPNNNYALNQADTTAIDIHFGSAMNFVSIRAQWVQASDAFLGFNGSLPFMAVYNSDTISAANRIGLVSWDISTDPCLLSGGAFCFSGWDTLDFTGTSNIKAIRITGAAPLQGSPTRRAIFDTLTFDAGNPVPEPASILLVGAALVGMRAIQRRRSHTGRGSGDAAHLAHDQMPAAGGPGQYLETSEPVK